MKSIFIILFLFFHFIFNGQNISYTQWNKEAETNIRLLPKYGNISEINTQLETDKQAINKYLSMETYEDAAKYLVSQGFNYITQGNLKTAMYRFNQAWLINPKNENAFWGFGTIYFIFQDYEKALQLYNEGLAINTKNPNLLTDKAAIYLSKFYIERDYDALNQAIELLSQSYTLDSTNPNTLFKLSGSYFFKQDCKNAVKYFKESETLGGESITEEYREAISNKCGI